MNKKINKGSIKEVIKNHKKELTIAGVCLISGSFFGMTKYKPNKRDQTMLDLVHYLDRKSVV